MLKVTNLSKRHSNKFCLTVLEMKILPGEVAAIVGPNGAGKSTLFQQLSGQQSPHSGTILFRDEVLQIDNLNLRKKIGYLPQHLSLPKWVSGREILRYLAALLALPNVSTLIEETLDYWDCMDFATTPMANCSHGMQKRVALACATIHQPEYLILDEPFSGLDIFHIKSLEKTLEQRQKQQKITLMSTHIMPFVVQYSDRLFFLQQGACCEQKDWAQLDSSERSMILEKHFFAKETCE